ncbi:MAG: hypothetical protein JST00_44580 [Deltaproteobacteria bacterium]|nr:hypothetical protein [Deltaproteobacteria bacterium]
MNCQRAAEVLRGLEKNELSVTTEEIEEMLSFGLAVEVDPDDLTLAQWLAPQVQQLAQRGLDDPHAATAIAAALRQLEEELAKDWYRMKTSKAVLSAQEAERVAMRRVLAHLNDPQVMAAVRTVTERARQVAPGLPWVADNKLGSELYAMTHKGWRVRRQLKIRLDRFGEASLKAFLASFEKVENKMRTFATDVGHLSQNVGYVRKNREQVVIGLIKTGAPVPKALGAYHSVMNAAGNAPDVAVTCTRNADTFGSPTNAAHMLRQAQAALLAAGFPNTPLAMGCAKALLAFQPPAAGVPRFREIFARLQHMLGGAEITYKLTTRLMPAHGTPSDVVRRSVNAATLLTSHPSRVGNNRDVRMSAAALASMVRDDAALRDLVVRFREIEGELVKAGVSAPAFAEGDALECVACPGTPFEVVDTVAALVAQLSAGRRSERSDVAVAVAFAKRFAL